MEQSEEQKREYRRACNLIWNAAGDYTIVPEFCAYTPQGKADLYLNSILGAIYRFYEYARFARLFDALRGNPSEEFYSDLLWLALCRCGYERAVAERPVLRELRERYACELLKNIRNRRDLWRLDRLRRAHFERVLGRETHVSARENRLLDALELDARLETEEIVARLCGILTDFFHFTPDLNKKPPARKHRRVGRFRFGRKLSGEARDSAFRRQSAYRGGAGESGAPKAALLGGGSEESLRAYLARTFGAPLYSQAQTAELEKRLCTENHAGCHLHITRGELPAGSTGNFALDAQHARMQQQEQANRAYYHAREAQNRSALERLTAEIRNCLLVHAEKTPLPAKIGNLQASRVWRSQVLGDGRVFVRTPQDEPETLSVELLLDGSASQLGRQELVASQGYLIAQSLTRCRIPVRVSSFCSAEGCTVLRLFRDYGEPGKNEAIFAYSASGWNRDGLALRVAGDAAKKAPCTRRLLIVLSDASPNDDRRIPGRFAASKDYGGEAGVRDAAAAAASLRREGICPICVFTGGETEFPQAQKIYGSALARIPSPECFAEAVGTVIRREIEQMA